ncbi:MAG: hydroxymethylbilane synthase, partial [Pseudomonadota bacterium]|nr:hydroxymethylbilane synthase [Pseudomonadota bacterium]
MLDANRLRIATRKSALALWQAEHVKGLLERFHPHLN